MVLIPTLETVNTSIAINIVNIESQTVMPIIANVRSPKLECGRKNMEV